MSFDSASFHHGMRPSPETAWRELGARFVDRGLLNLEEWNRIQQQAQLSGTSPGELLRSNQTASEAEILREMAEITGIPFKGLHEYQVDTGLTAKIKAKTALRYQVLPVQDDAGVITLATAVMPESMMEDSLKMLLGGQIRWVYVLESELLKALSHFYGLGAQNIHEIITTTQLDELNFEGADIGEGSEEAGMIEFVHNIILEAIKMRATDIHIEPFEDHVVLRYRIDGLLQKVPLPEGIAKLKRSIASCIKNMASMDIAEKRKPHDGRIKVRAINEEFDLRVSVLPTRHGETVNMRILSRGSMSISLATLGIQDEDLPMIKYLGGLPHGIVLLTGPTGSGKTTTLYAMLNELKSDEAKIITVEDPIEYQMEGISQLQVHSKIGLTFASILRSILRHDPDIVLIGEIRDAETADIAVRASLTGHLVLSTLHTNDAPSAVTRLVDMGIEPYLVSSCLEGVVAQRLVRRICSKCKEPAEMPPPLIPELEAQFGSHLDFSGIRKGSGCADCNYTGYHGRTALHEIMMVDDDLRMEIIANKPANEIRETAAKKGLTSLRQKGWKMVLNGETTVDEILRVTQKQSYHSTT
ncbi:GspE/PulE family protein [Kiritimatiellaeota bacterium B1221]|nr:GspE/PulE family protein [Kiritimatiellaeota bacterium B1221]